MFDATYRTLTYGFRIRTPLADVAGRLDDLLAPFRLDTANGVPTFEIRIPRKTSLYRVVLNGRLVLRSRSAAGAIDYLLWRASKETIDRASGFLVLHAGAVSFGRKGVVLPAPPDSGKTTLTAGLTRAGFRYLSDEAAFLELGTGRLHPFPRALWMDRETLDVLPGVRETLPAFVRGPRDAYHVDPTELRPGSIGTPCRVRFVIAPTYAPGRTSLEPMSRAETLVALARNSFNAERVGVRGIRLLGDVVRAAECYRLVMGDLGAAVQAVSELVGADASEPSE